MSFRPRSTTTKGLTLIELLVSMSVFLGLMAMVFALLSQNRQASQKAIGQADVSASVLLVFEKIRQEVRSGRVVGSSNPSELEYWVYDRDTLLPKFGGPHGLIYLPGPNSDPDVAVLGLDEGRLVRTFQGQQKMFVSLGKNGEISFDWNPGLHTLIVAGIVDNPYGETEEDPDNIRAYQTTPRNFRFMLSLNNVE